MMNRKTSIVVCLALFVAVSLFAPAVGRAASPASAPASKQPIVLKALSCFPKTAISVRTMGLIVERVKARSKGELTINWVGGPEAMALLISLGL